MRRIIQSWGGKEGTFGRPGRLRLSISSKRGPWQSKRWSSFQKSESKILFSFHFTKTEVTCRRLLLWIRAVVEPRVEWDHQKSSAYFHQSDKWLPHCPHVQQMYTKWQIGKIYSDSSNLERNKTARRLARVRKSFRSITSGLSYGKLGCRRRWPVTWCIIENLNLPRKLFKLG